MTNWSYYFPFPANDEFFIDGPAWYDGQGQVLENTGTRLMLRFDLKKTIGAPAFHATITVEYRQEGKGNIGILAEDGQPPQQDNDAEIYSDDQRRERKVISSSLTFCIRYLDQNKVGLVVCVNEKSYHFDLKRTGVR